MYLCVTKLTVVRFFEVQLFTALPALVNQSISTANTLVYVVLITDFIVFYVFCSGARCEQEICFRARMG